MKAPRLDIRVGDRITFRAMRPWGTTDPPATRVVNNVSPGPPRRWHVRYRHRGTFAVYDVEILAINGKAVS